MALEGVKISAAKASAAGTTVDGTTGGFRVKINRVVELAEKTNNREEQDCKLLKTFKRLYKKANKQFCFRSERL